MIFIKMTSVLDKFNSILLQFLSEIDKLYPDSQAKFYHNMIKMALVTDKTIWINLFADEAIKHEKEIMTKNEKYFLEENIIFIKRLNLDHYYSISNENTKESIWKYIISLFLLSCSYKGYSKEIIQNIQDLAKNNTHVSSKDVMEQLKKMN